MVMNEMVFVAPTVAIIGEREKKYNFFSMQREKSLKGKKNGILRGKPEDAAGTAWGEKALT